jgi:hypothetical protein
MVLGLGTRGCSRLDWRMLGASHLPATRSVRMAEVGLSYGSVLGESVSDGSSSSVHYTSAGPGHLTYVSVVQGLQNPWLFYRTNGFVQTLQ